MRARGRGMTWWARTAQKSGSRLLPNAAVPVWLSSAFKERAMAPDENLAPEAPCCEVLLDPWARAVALEWNDRPDLSPAGPETAG